MASFWVGVGVGVGSAAVVGAWSVWQVNKLKRIVKNSFAFVHSRVSVLETKAAHLEARAAFVKADLLKEVGVVKNALEARVAAVKDAASTVANDATKVAAEEKAVSVEVAADVKDVLRKV